MYNYRRTSSSLGSGVTFLEDSKTKWVMERPECNEGVDELDYVCELQERLKDAYEVAKEH